MPNTDWHIQIVPSVAGAIGKYAKSDSSKKLNLLLDGFLALNYISLLMIVVK